MDETNPLSSVLNLPQAADRGRDVPDSGNVMRRYWRKYEEDARVVAAAMGLALLVGCIVVAIGSPRWVNGLLWAGACSAIGWMAGFLFGIPRSLSSEQAAAPAKQSAVAAAAAGSGASAATTPAQPASGSAGTPTVVVRSRTSTVQVNTNLEQISDWLTKIIVGVTLVELRPVMQQLDNAAALIAGALGGKDQASFAYALMLYFSITGFLGSYLLTRLFLQRAFRDVDSH